MSDLADSYEAMVQLGYRALSDRWRNLGASTRATFLRLGLATESGVKPSVRPDDDDLVYQLGILKAAATAKLPAMARAGEPISFEAIRDEVPQACSLVTRLDALRDPLFAELALVAITQHCLADALSRAKPDAQVGTVGLLVTGLVRIGLVVMTPAAAALCIWSATNGQLGLSIGAAYLAAFGIAAAWEAGKGEWPPKPRPENLEFSRWLAFRLNQLNVAAPLGTAEHLRKMLNDGVRVPSVAFDLCALLSRGADK